MDGAKNLQFANSVDGEKQPKTVNMEYYENNIFRAEKTKKDDVPSIARRLNFSDGELDSVDKRLLINALSEYEDVNDRLQVLFGHYQSEHAGLKEEFIVLTKENERLSNELKKRVDGEILSLTSSADGNLRQQLSVALQEKEVVLDLWRLAVSEVTNLEKVIKILQEQKEDQCHSCTSQDARAEAQRAEANREREKKLEEQLTSALASNKILEQDKERMQRALDVLKGQLKELSLQADEGQSKVSDALALVDSACVNRDHTVLALSTAQEEIARLEKALETLTQEAKEQVKREVEQVKQQCNSHVRNILSDMRRCQEEGNEMKNKAEQAQKQAEQLSQLKTQELQGVRSIDASLQPRLLALQSQLRDYEERCNTAEAKAKRLQLNFEQEHQRWSLNETKVAESCKQLEKQVIGLAQELEDCRSRESELQQQFRLREQQFSWRVTELEKSSKETVVELHTIVKAHQSISEKSQVELKQMATKFSTRLKELRGEVVRLRQERDYALHQLHNYKLNRSVTITPSRPKSLYLDV